MRASKQALTGSAGANEVSAKFERIGWGPVPNHAHDLGTDLLVQTRDRRRFDRGLIVGAQVKAGSSWFSEEERGESGQLEGWWYYEPETDHFDAWVTHGLPHLLVLHDLDANVSYWAHVTADRVTRTGKGCKILVPVSQTIDDEHLEELLAVAARQKASPAIEGTAFHASAQAVAPGRRLRHALIAPRLVAPHRNAGHSNPVTPEEALALCAQGRFRDLKQFAKQHTSVPDPEVPYDGNDWRWAFVRAVWAWAAGSDLEPLRIAYASAAGSEGKAASGVLLACLLRRGERPGDALDVLNALLEDDDLGPVDHAWVLVQRSRIRADVGDIVGARADAAEAQRSFQGDADDVTASALAAAAAWHLFATAGFGAEDIGATLTASDTAVSWWRSQTVSWALDEASNRAFRAWSQTGGTHWSSEDALALNLFAAELNADLTGEHGTWRAVAGLASREQLMGAGSAGQEADTASALDALRLSGDHASLKLAVSHLYDVGPVAAVADAVSRIPPHGWTHTTAQANLQLLAHAGDLLDSDDADRRIEMLMTLFAGDASEFVERVRPTFTVNFEAAKAIAGVLPAASSIARGQVAELLASQPGAIDELLVPPLTSWIRELKSENPNPQVRSGLRALSMADHGRVGAASLAWLADHDDDQAKQEVVVRAIAGDLDALGAMGAVTVLTSEQAKNLIEKFESMAAAKLQQAAKGVWSVGGVDAARALALFNLWFPNEARWDPLLRLLTHAMVRSGDKRGALELIIELAERVPAEVRDELAKSVDALASAPTSDGIGDLPIGGLATVVGIVTEAICDDDADVAVARMAVGTQQERCDAADLLGRGWCERMRPLLPAFVADDRTAVRVAAARAVGRLASSHPDAVVVELARLLAKDPGRVVPSALVVGLSRVERTTDLGREIAARLLEHRSARVRSLARRFLTSSPDAPMD